MANPQDSVRKKILEELQLTKKILKQGEVPPTTPASALPIPGGSVLNQVTETSRAAQNDPLSQANTKSYGSYVLTDSKFGNSILPVLPRFEDDPPPKK